MRSCEVFLAQSDRPLLILGSGNSVIFFNNSAIEIFKKRGNIVNIQRIFPLPEGILIYLAVDTSADTQSLIIHQLRAPLSAIRWNIELLLSDDDLAKSEQSELLNNIYKVNRYLISLVNDLLQSARIDSGRAEVHPKATGIKELIPEVIDILEPIAKEKGQKIIINELAPAKPVFVDPDLFIKVFENLLDNAISYGAENSKVIINLSFDEVRQAYVISITNYGPVIPESDKNKLFSKFYRGEQAKKIKLNGSGLGLFIAKSAVEMNGGNIWFDSSAEKGTTFYFTAPVK